MRVRSSVSFDLAIPPASFSRRNRFQPLIRYNNDDDDFELAWILDRNIAVGNAMVRGGELAAQLAAHGAMPHRREARVAQPVWRPLDVGGSAGRPSCNSLGSLCTTRKHSRRSSTPPTPHAGRARAASAARATIAGADAPLLSVAAEEHYGAAAQ